MRLSVLTAANKWLQTPYHHRASRRGVGADCLGLICGIISDVYGLPAQALPRYTRDWNEVEGKEQFSEGLAKVFTAVPIEEAIAGDLFLFAMMRRPPAKHIAILECPTSKPGKPWRDGQIIDAREIGGVARRKLDRALKARTAFAYRFPDSWPKSL